MEAEGLSQWNIAIERRERAREGGRERGTAALQSEPLAIEVISIIDPACTARLGGGGCAIDTAVARDSTVVVVAAAAARVWKHSGF